jgi:hypothetical protein
MTCGKWLYGKLLPFFVILLLALPSLHGCVDTKDRTPKVKQALLRYHQLLREGYLNVDMKGLSDVTTPNHAAKLEHRISAYKMKNIRMETELKSIEFLEIKFSGRNSVMVKTREAWYASHVDTITGRKIKEVNELVYLMNYEMLRKKAQWRIDSATIAEERIADE